AARGTGRVHRRAAAPPGRRGGCCGAGRGQPGVPVRGADGVRRGGPAGGGAAAGGRGRPGRGAGR
ncbi:unnamed protein product, partial [Heterosigma akashiwo]